MPAKHVVTLPGSTIFPVISSTANSTLYCHSQPYANVGIADASKKLMTGRAIPEIRKKVDVVQSVKPNVCLLAVEGDPALLYFQGLVLGERANILLDMGVSHSFAPERLVQDLQLLVQECTQ